MARYSLFVLKVPLNQTKPGNRRRKAKLPRAETTAFKFLR